ncbi:MAG: DNA recombination protein RmuC [Tenericutes bacterium]|jgi:DNA recombination protein RmuC|nr:DNA recombination protein RmuC [Mycoplasmatota bacterium]
MVLIEIIGIIILSFIVLVFILLVYLVFFSRKEQTINIDKEIDQLEKNIKSELNDSLLKFNNEVNRQLMHSSELSSKNIAEFRLNINSQMSEFQEKISNKFNLEFKSLSTTVEKRMNEINEKVEERLSKGFKDAQITFVDIAKRVEVIDEAQKNIKELSEEMVSLQNILSHNQSRGAYGEYQLNQLLYSIYGNNQLLYKTQYTIKDNDKSVRVDAAVFMPEPNGIIGIDSKFPYSSYSKLFDNKDLSKEEESKIISAFGRDVKKHITDIANKYIMPPITTDYALMFVPSDGILALLHSKLQNVIEYAREKFITIVSPTTIVPLLSSFKTFMIDYERSQNMEKINRELIKLSKDFNIFSKEWEKLSRSIQTVKNDTDKFDSRVEKINMKFGSIKNVGIEDRIDDQ